ncbi:TetR/AcrR family transcriptional regulator [Defluviicoccus vanus]|uniref:TetR/AcrR family transcriptional regulator n=1 Tax=Defluviicoccus vanus TaxID=111831 RepID=A0A7H1N042_9PROT|nr:TetR/AcrR family transcriptional regulator [Defluviicoccus vanus]QNT69078.1 TetR/AcrR family transcriptional regulator [Defluviicoccus vanus]
MPTARAKPKRGMDRQAIVEAAFAMIAEAGEADFSLRKLASRVGVDPMTVLYHVKSKDELLRAVADMALATIELPAAAGEWRADLRRVAVAYRDLARRHPRVFPLHFRYYATGPADYRLGETVYAALVRAGLSDAQASRLGLAFYTFILGFALSQISGLVGPASVDEVLELEALAAEKFPITRRLIPAFVDFNADLAFTEAIDAVLDGIARQAAAMPSPP